MGRDRLDVLAPGDAQTSLKAKVGDRSWGVLWANRRGQEKAADWPFQKSGIRVVYPLEKGNGGMVEKWRSGGGEE